MRCLFVLLALVPLARAEDWNEFRGPTGEGHSKAKNVPTEWGPDKNVAWKVNIAGKAWSTPVVVGGKVYLTTAVGDTEQDLRALCLDAATGKTSWDNSIFSKKTVKMHGKNSQASPTPLLVGDRLYVHFGHYGTACLDLSGKVIWKNEKLAFPPVHGNGGSPVLVDGILAFTRDGTGVRELVGLDAATGEVKWQTKRTEAPGQNPFSFGTPLVIEVNGQKQIVSPASGMVGGYDPKTGEELWHVKYTGYSVIPRPVYAHGLVFVSSSYNNPVLLAIRPNGKGDITKTHVEWKTPTRAPHTPSPLVVGNELFIVSDNGFASCLDVKTGKVYWSQRLSGSGYSASPVAVDGKVYFLSEDGIGTIVRAGTKFEVVAKNELKERTLASYAMIDGALFVRTAERLYRFGRY
ncbi:MAG: serine/threonine protein kinase [Planctomycetia bacterium]|nr:serine/threonine protein kinase [Planctomycetia bacterium]